MANKSRYTFDRFKKDLGGWLIMLPTIVLFVFFVWKPLASNVELSFYSTHGFAKLDFVGLRNYKDIFADPRFVKAALNTLQYVGWSLLIGFLVPIVLGVFLSEIIHIKGFLRLSIYFPSIISGMAIAILWSFLFDPNAGAPLNTLLKAVGLKPWLWLDDPQAAIPLIVVTMTWRGAGGTMLIYLASIQSIDNSLYEAARLEGAGPLKRFFYVTLPHLSSTIKLLFILQIISVLQVFYEPLVMTKGGGPNDASLTLVLLAYQYAFQGSIIHPEYAASVGVILSLFIVFLTVVYIYAVNRQSKAEKENTVRKMTLRENIQGLNSSLRRFPADVRYFFGSIGPSLKYSFSGFRDKTDNFFKSVKSFFGDMAQSFISFLSKAKSSLKNMFSRKGRNGDSPKTHNPRKLRYKNEGIMNWSDYRKKTNKAVYALIFTFVFIAALVAIIPFGWLAVSSFKTPAELYASQYVLWPSKIDFSKIIEVLNSSFIIRSFGNTVIVVLGAVVCSVVFNGLLAYVISILKPKGHKIIFALVMLSYMIPAVISIVPLYKQIVDLGLIGSYIPLWLAFGANAFYLVMFKNYFDSIPRSLIEAGRIDGASSLQIFFKLVVPLSRPIIGVVAIFTLSAAWSDFLLPYLVLMNNVDLQTVMVRIFSLQQTMATSPEFGPDKLLMLLVLSIIPQVILFAVFQKQIMNTSVTSGLKE